MSDVVFVYLGQTLPRYVGRSLKLAAKYSGQRVLLIANGIHAKKFKNAGAEFIAIEEFYDPSEFAMARNQILLDHEFREGFWLYSFERLFVLGQFMAWTGSESLFHAELDQLLFGTSDLVDHLERTHKKGVFFPFHSPNKAVASVLFVNARNSLHRLIRFSTSSEPFNNEMELLVRFSKAFPEDSVELPTVGAALPQSSSEDFVFTENFVKPTDIGPGAVDAAELGLWVGGRDPRNLGWEELPSTKWVYEQHKASLGRKYLEELHFHFEPSARLLQVTHNQDPGAAIRLYNLHIQSKVHSWIWRKDPELHRLFESANSSSSMKIFASRKLQFRYALTEQQGIRRRIQTFFRFIKYALRIFLIRSRPFTAEILHQKVPKSKRLP